MQTYPETNGKALEAYDFVYFYTPLCGTCQLAQSMLEIVRQTQQFSVVALNLNHYPSFAQTWRIEQVPCLMATQTQTKLYTFANVVNVYDFCRRQLRSKEN